MTPNTTFRVDIDACRRLSVASLVCVPLRRGTEAMGVLAVNAKRSHAFTDEDVSLLACLGGFLSVAVGSACELWTASNDLLALCQRRNGVAHMGASMGSSSEAASRYMMSVLDPEAVNRLDCSERIQRVLDDPSLVSIVYQPVVDLVTDRVVAVEALARFDVSPYQAPDVWFREAHDQNLGIDLELMAVNHALEQLPMLPEGVDLTINGGPELAMSSRFAEALLAHPNQRIILELTEHVRFGDYPRLVESLGELRKRGIRLAIDDTGSGYSSLTHILKLAPDFIKLDRDLVSGIDIDPVRRSLASSLVTFAAETGAQIIAEGAERADEVAALRTLGIHYAQGRFLGHPARLDTLFTSPFALSHSL